ncbi:MAG: hypothetical protein J6K53_10645 [Roseburia sp.]|nr:hypothetical protein [Roseburia sp.]
MPKSNLCEDRIAKKASGAKKIIAGGLSEKSYEEISKKTGIAERSLHNYIGIHGDLSKASFERVLALADVAGVKVTFELKD